MSTSQSQRPCAWRPSCVCLSPVSFAARDVAGQQKPRVNPLIARLEQGLGALSGTDWMFIDMEHGPYLLDRLQATSFGPRCVISWRSGTRATRSERSDLVIAQLSLISIAQLSLIGADQFILTTNRSVQPRTGVSHDVHAWRRRPHRRHGRGRRAMRTTRRARPLVARGGGDARLRCPPRAQGTAAFLGP